MRHGAVLGALGLALSLLPAGSRAQDPLPPDLLSPDMRENLTPLLFTMERFERARCMPDPDRRERELERLRRDVTTVKARHKVESLLRRWGGRRVNRRSAPAALRAAKLLGRWLTKVEGQGPDAVLDPDRFARIDRLLGDRDPRGHAQLDSLLLDLEDRFLRTAGTGPVKRPGTVEARAGSSSRGGPLLARQLSLLLGVGFLGVLLGRQLGRGIKGAGPAEEPDEIQYLDRVHRLKELYEAEIHRLKNLLTVGHRYAGDPRGLERALSPEYLQELAELTRRGQERLADPRLSLRGAARGPAAAALQELLADTASLLARIQALPRTLAGAGTDRAFAVLGELSQATTDLSHRIVETTMRCVLDLSSLFREAVEPLPYRERVLVAPVPDAVDSSLVKDRSTLEASLPTALANLLDNARLAGAQSITLCATLEPRVPGAPALSVEPETLRVTVEDDGPGVPEELRGRLFTPGTTGRSDGTGMGLYSSQKLMRRLGGDITYQPASPGSRFVLTLPVMATRTLDVAPAG